MVARRSITLVLYLVVFLLLGFVGARMVHAVEDAPSIPGVLRLFLPFVSLEINEPDFTPPINPEEILNQNGDDSLGVHPDCYVPNNPFPHGQCTWWAAEVRRDIRAQVRGNAKDWLNYIPSVFRNKMPESGDLAIFQPGVAGADATYGHVAYITYVMPYDWDGRRWFYMVEANGPSWAPIRFYHNGIAIRGRWMYRHNTMRKIPIITITVLVSVVVCLILLYPAPKTPHSFQPDEVREVLVGMVDTSSWQELEFKGCGEQKSDEKFVVYVPPAWFAGDDLTYNSATVHEVTNGDSIIQFSCGEGFGGANCEEFVTFVVDSEVYPACFATGLKGKESFIIGNETPEVSYYINADYQSSEEEMIRAIIGNSSIFDK